ncbi:MAG: portal protein [Geminicoccaceae bacterium]
MKAVSGWSSSRRSSVSAPGSSIRRFCRLSGFRSDSLDTVRGLFEQSPFLTFRWMKGTSELYGRSPVMTALPISRRRTRSWSSFSRTRPLPLRGSGWPRTMASGSSQYSTCPRQHHSKGRGLSRSHPPSGTRSVRRIRAGPERSAYPHPAYVARRPACARQ